MDQPNQDLQLHPRLDVARNFALNPSRVNVVSPYDRKKKTSGTNMKVGIFCLRPFDLSVEPMLLEGIKYWIYVCDFIEENYCFFLAPTGEAISVTVSNAITYYKAYKRINPFLEDRVIVTSADRIALMSIIQNFLAVSERRR